VSAEADWADIVVGDVVIGAKDNEPWTVVARDEKHTVLANGTRRVTMESHVLRGRVLLAMAEKQRAERAEALVKIRLGGETVGKANGDGTSRCPQFFTDPGSLLAHLYLFHSDPDRDVVYPDGTMGALIEAHDKMHIEGMVHEPHTHDPSFYAD